MSTIEIVVRDGLWMTIDGNHIAIEYDTEAAPDPCFRWYGSNDHWYSQNGKTYVTSAQEKAGLSTYLGKIPELDKDNKDGTVTVDRVITFTTTKVLADTYTFPVIRKPGSIESFLSSTGREVKTTAVGSIQGYQLIAVSRCMFDKQQRLDKYMDRLVFSQVCIPPGAIRLIVSAYDSGETHRVMSKSGLWFGWNTSLFGELPRNETRHDLNIDLAKFQQVCDATQKKNLV